MLEPPDLADAVIVEAVRAHYGIPVAAATFLPIGNDSSAWVYRVQATDGAAYFLKVRSGTVNEASLSVPRHLQDRGVAHVVAPLPTISRALWLKFDRFALALYPFIDGVTGMDGGMTERDWVRYGAALRRVHATPLPPELRRCMQRESYAPAWSGMVRRLDTHIATRTFDDLVEHELAEFWRARRAEIRTLLERAEVLGRRLHALAPPFVLCHADIHTRNVLLDAAGGSWTGTRRSWPQESAT